MRWTWKLIFCLFSHHEKAKGDWRNACCGTKLIRICPRCTAIIEERPMMDAEIKQHIAYTMRKRIDKGIEEAILGKPARIHHSAPGQIFSSRKS